MTQTEKKFSTYSQYAKHWLIENEIKLKNVYVEDGNYNPHFVYLNRVSRYDKNKANFRVLKPGIDKVKNCILITFNTERHDREYISYLIQLMQPVLKNWCNGTCQTFITQNMVAQVLSGCVNPRTGKMNSEVLN